MKQRPYAYSRRLAREKASERTELRRRMLKRGEQRERERERRRNDDVEISLVPDNDGGRRRTGGHTNEKLERPIQTPPSSPAPPPSLLSPQPRFFSPLLAALAPFPAKQGKNKSPRWWRAGAWQHAQLKCKRMNNETNRQRFVDEPARGRIQLVSFRELQAVSQSGTDDACLPFRLSRTESGRARVNGSNKGDRQQRVQHVRRVERWCNQRSLETALCPP